MKEFVITNEAHLFSYHFLLQHYYARHFWCRRFLPFLSPLQGANQDPPLCTFRLAALLLLLAVSIQSLSLPPSLSLSFSFWSQGHCSFLSYCPLDLLATQMSLFFFFFFFFLFQQEADFAFRSTHKEIQDSHMSLNISSSIQLRSPF
jgi:hypothetical protein